MWNAFGHWHKTREHPVDRRARGQKLHSHVAFLCQHQVFDEVQGPAECHGEHAVETESSEIRANVGVGLPAFPEKCAHLADFFLHETLSGAHVGRSEKGVVSDSSLAVQIVAGCAE